MVHREKQSTLILFFQKSVFGLVWKFIFLRKDHRSRKKASPIETFHWKFVNKTNQKPTQYRVDSDLNPGSESLSIMNNNKFSVGKRWAAARNIFFIYEQMF